MEFLRKATVNWLAASKNQKLKLALVVVGLSATGLLALMSGTPSGNAGDFAPSGWYYAGVVIKLAGVLLFFIGGAVVVSRWQRKTRRVGAGRSLMLVETVRLSQKQALHLVRVGDQHILVGATDQSVALVTAVEMDLEEDEDAIPQTSSGLDFRQILSGMSGLGGAKGSLTTRTSLQKQSL